MKKRTKKIAPKARKIASPVAAPKSELTDLGQYIKGLNDKIMVLKNAPSTRTPELQGALENLLAAGAEVTTRFEALRA